MELVNNRFRILRSIKQNRIVSTYLAADLMDGHNEIVLNILNSEFLPEAIIEFYVHEFLRLVSFNNRFLLRNYNFNIVSYIDNKKPHNLLYFFTSEYKESEIDFFDLCEELHLLKRLDVFIQIVNGVNYLHLKGIYYEELSLSNLIFYHGVNGYKVKLKDLATVQLEKYSIKQERSEEAFFRNPYSYKEDTQERSEDMYSLGVLLLLMIRGRKALESTVAKELLNLKEEILGYSGIPTEEERITIKLVPLLEKLLSRRDQYPYLFLKDFLQEFNQALAMDYSIFSKEEIGKLNFKIRLIDHDDEVNEVLTAYHNMMKAKPVKKFFLVHGESGTGKTRLLEEFHFRLNMIGANIYSSFSLSDINESSNKMWIELLRKLIADGDSEVIDKYESELNEFFPELMERKGMNQALALNRDNAKYRLLNRITSFINDNLRSKPLVFLVDNIHFANEFTIDTFAYLYNEIIKNKNVILIYSYMDSEILHNKKLREFLARIHENNETEDIYLRDLEYDQTAVMVRYLLGMPSTPYQVAKRIYKKSYGNPLFVTEIIKNLFNKKSIYINDGGMWDSDYDTETYDYLPIPNSLEQALLNQIKDTDDTGQEILEIISVFVSAVSIEDIGKLTDFSLEEIEKSVNELVFNGIICRKIGDKSYVFDINNRVLKDIVYQKIANEEKLRKHRAAAQILEDGYDAELGGNTEELIYHLEQAKVWDKVMKFCIDSAAKMELLKNRSIQIKYLEKALFAVEHMENSNKIDLLIKIGSLYFAEGDLTKALESFEQAEKDAADANDTIGTIKTYVNMTNVYYAKNDKKAAAATIDRLEILLEGSDYLEGYLECRRLHITEKFSEQNYADVEAIANEILEKAGKDYDWICCDVYRYLGMVKVQRGNVQEGIECYNKAIKLSERANKLNSMLLALNNMGVMYADYYQDYDVALEYFEKNKNISEENNFQSAQMFAFTNIAEMYFAKLDYVKAYEYNLLALQIARKFEFEDSIFYCYNQLVRTLLHLDNYVEAIRYHKLSDEELKNYPDQGRDISEYYRSSSELFYKLGEYELSENYAKQAIEIYGSEESSVNLITLVQLQYIHIKSKDIDKMSECADRLMALSQKFVSPEHRVRTLSEGARLFHEIEQPELGHKLMVEAGKSMFGKISESVRALYMLVTGLLGHDDQRLDRLITGLKAAKNIKQRELTIRLSNAIGDFYFQRNNHFFAANYYIEAFETSKEVIHQIPDDYKLKFVNCNHLLKAYIRTQQIRNKYVEGIQDEVDEDLQSTEQRSEIIFSINELKRILKDDVINAFIMNREFIYSIRKLYMSFLPKGIKSEKDLLVNVGSDNIKNIEMVIRYMASITLATNGYVVLEDTFINLSPLAAMNEIDSHKRSKQILDRVKATAEPILILDKMLGTEEDHFLMPDDMRACLCIPILTKDYRETIAEGSNQKQSSSKANILGYIYLESDQILNNFNYNSFQKCLELSNFMQLLMEKYQLKIAASIDKLTGALTRKYLEEALTSSVEKAEFNGESFSIILYDLDRFKSINDRFGHQTGDEVLRKVSRLVNNNISRNDVLGRYGGEEFIIILSNTDYEDALQIADELRRNIQNERILGDKAEITVSMGIASYPIHGIWEQELIEKADQALYVAKEDGRNRCQVWDSKFSKKVKGTNKLSGIISGNSVQDSRNVLVLVELIALMNKNIKRQDKIHSMLGRIVEIFEAQYGMLLILEGTKIIKSYARKALSEETIDFPGYNNSAVQTVIENRQGIYRIDWDYIGTHDMMTNIPDWYSILVVPVFVDDKIKGILYLSASVRTKEFGFNDFNFLSVISDLAANIL